MAKMKTNKPRKSKIFTATEYEELEVRLQGQKKNYNIWRRVKLKLIEIISLFESKEKIEKIIQEGQKKKIQ